MSETIFLSYSHVDEKWKTSVLTHLSPWNLEVWDDSEIEIGSVWLQKINEALARCSTAILLLSPDYLNSKFIMQRELPQILDAVTTKGLRLICIHVRANSFEATELHNFQSANNPARPLSLLPAGDVDAELKRISFAIASISNGGTGRAVLPRSNTTDIRSLPVPEHTTEISITAETIEADKISMVNLDGTNPTKDTARTQIGTKTLRTGVLELTNQRNKET